MRVIVGFARARARAALAPLLALAVVAAIATGLAVGVIGAVRAVEASAVVAAVADAGGDRDRIVVRFDAADPAAADVPDAVAGALSAIGAGGSLSTRSDVASGLLEYTVDPAYFTADAAIALIVGLPDLRDEIQGRVDTDVQVSGGLRSTLLSLSGGLEDRRGPTAVGLAILGLMAGVVVAIVAIEPVRARTAETRLLRARGARSRTLLGLAGAETVVCAGAGAAVGAVIATLAVSVVTGVVLPAWIGVAAAVAATVVALVSAQIATARSVRRRSTRADATAGVGLAVLAAVLTGIALWQFVDAGTPVVERANGAAGLDPIVALAPALTLALAALLAVLAATPLARASARLLERTRGLAPVIPVRLASRRPGRHALTTAVVAFAIGTITLAGAYQGTIAAVGDTPEALRVGADVRVTSLPDDADTAVIGTLDGVEASMHVRAVSARGADERVTVLAADAGELGEVMLDAGGTIDPGALGASLQVPAVGARIPDGAEEISIRVAVAEPAAQTDPDGNLWQPGPPIVMVSVVLTADDGRTAELRASNTEFREVETSSGPWLEPITHAERIEVVAVPDGGPWRVTLVGAVNPEWGGDADASVELTTSAGAVDVSDYRLRGDGAAVEPAGTGLRFRLPAPGVQDPQTPYAVPSAAPTAAPAAITRELAASLALETGDVTSLQVPDFRGAVDLEIVEIIPVLPGSASGEGVLVDRAAVATAVGQPVDENEVWVAAADPAAVAEAVATELPGARTDVADHGAAAAAADTAWAFVLAAAGAAVLALVVLVLRRTRSRADAREIALLAVLGAGRSGARRVRVAEDLFALAMGVVGGLAAGAVTAWLVVPPLVRAAYVSVPDGLRIELHADALVFAGAVAASVGVFALVVASVRAPSALSPLVREDE